jgi:hypothetical protein
MKRAHHSEIDMLDLNEQMRVKMLKPLDEVPSIEMGHQQFHMLRVLAWGSNFFSVMKYPRGAICLDGELGYLGNAFRDEANELCIFPIARVVVK